MITLHPKPGIELLVVEVPEGFKFTCIKGNDFYFKADVWNFEQIGHLIGLPPGNYSFIATSRDITEEQAAELGFESTENLYKAIRAEGGDFWKHNYAILKRER